MVDFTLTDEQKDIRQLAHDFAEKEIRPVAWELDKESTFPHEIIEKAWEVGLMNSHIPEEYGGPGLDYLSGCLIEEELGWGCSGIGTSLMCNGLATAPVIIGAPEELKKRYLGMLTEEAKLASFCLTEPDAGSDVSSMRTSAVRQGDKYVINGTKCFITNGSHASWYTVYAKTDREAGHRGISAFIVPRDADGVTVDKKEDKLGQRASDTAMISFNDVEIPADHLVGEENKGFKLAMMTLDRTRPGVSAMAVGIAQAAFEYPAANSNAARAMPTASAETPGRVRSRVVIASLKPWFSSPSRFSAGTSVSLNVTVAVFDARWPILSSFLSITTVSSRSTTKAEMPRWPASGSVLA